MKAVSLDELFFNELKELFDAERKCLSLLPKLAEAASSTDLRNAFLAHCEETQGHLSRLERVFVHLEKSPQGRTCETVKDLVYDGQEAIRDLEGSVRDASLIATAQRLEHFEIASYRVVLRFAQELGNDIAAHLLEETLLEEKAADETLSQIAESRVDPQAVAVGYEWS